jgi:hypothetical protein
MLNEQFAWLTPFSQLDWPGFAWRTEARKGRTGESGRFRNRPVLAAKTSFFPGLMPNSLILLLVPVLTTLAVK